MFLLSVGGSLGLGQKIGLFKVFFFLIFIKFFILCESQMLERNKVLEMDFFS